MNFFTAGGLQKSKTNNLKDSGGKTVIEWVILSEISDATRDVVDF